jgi:ATP-binding cassette subfamily F protein uup
LERVTDTQYALLGDGALRHLPRGVDQYLELRGDAGKKSANQQSAPKATGAELRASQKAIQKLERGIEKLEAEETALQIELQRHNPSDQEGLAVAAQRAKELATQKALLEAQWMELSETI